MVPPTKRNHHRQIIKRFQTNVANPPQSDEHKRNVLDHPQENTEKLTVPTMTPQTTIRENS